MNEALLLENADADLWHVKYNHMIEDQFVMGCQQPFPTLYLLICLINIYTEKELIHIDMVDLT